MQKYFAFIALLLIAATTAHASLWNFFNGQLPPLAERAMMYKAIGSDEYQGTYEQNVRLEAHLKGANNGLDTLFGGTFLTPSVAALYEDSLASGITSAATSFTLVRGTDKHGTALASSTYGFILDEGSSNEELVLADCTSTACTNATRGVSVLTGTSTVAGNATAHRRGASVKITDAPILLFVANVFKGKQWIENMLRYSSSVAACSANDDICDKAYIDGIASAGAADANQTTKGLVEIATGAEAATSKQNGTGDTAAYLVLSSNNATSTPYTAGNYIVVTGSDGRITPGIMPTSSPWLVTGSTTHTGVFTMVNATATQATTTYLSVGTHASSTLATIGGLGVGGVSTSSQGNLRVATYLQVDGTASTSVLNVSATNGCAGCQKGYEIVTNTASGPTSGGAGATVQVDCSAGKKVIGGGSQTDSTEGVFLQRSLPLDSDTWFAGYRADAGGDAANTLTVYAICVTP